MKHRWLVSVVVSALGALVLLAASSTSSGASEPSSAALQACGSISEGASGNAITACAQGYTEASSKATLAASCAFGVGAIEAIENEHDCKTGFILAGGPSSSPPTPSSAAVTECEAITRGASDGSPAACEQGYQDALAGDSQDASCDHLEEGAITAVEYATSCEDGWFVAKDEPGCIPGIDPENAQPGDTIEASATADKACASG